MTGALDKNVTLLYSRVPGFSGPITKAIVLRMPDAVVLNVIDQYGLAFIFNNKTQIATSVYPYSWGKLKQVVKDHYVLTGENCSSLLDSITSITNLTQNHSKKGKPKVPKRKPKFSRQRRARNPNSRKTRSIAKKSKQLNQKQKNSISKTSKSRGRKYDSEN